MGMAVLRSRITLVRIRILLFILFRIRILSFTLMRIRIEPDPTTDFFPDFILQCSKMTRKGFHLFPLMRIRVRILLYTLMQIRVRIQLSTLTVMQIRIRFPK
jgi:hypothetical protein